MEKKSLIKQAMENNDKVRRAVENFIKFCESEEGQRLAEIQYMRDLEENSILAEGREEGKKEKQIEIAKKLLKQKMPIKQIAEVTGLSEEEIEKSN